MIALDTETTGLDHWHGARPYFVTCCDEDAPSYFGQPDDDGKGNEWLVDPLTRQVRIPERDVQDIRLKLSFVPDVVFHNCKFDIHALHSADIVKNWNWSRTHDTVIAAHLLGSNLPKNLTDLAVRWLGVDIQPFEDRLKKAVQAARRWCRSHLKDWAIASKGRADMPSAKDKTWKYDGWLPRALLLHDELPTNADTSDWGTVLRDYANVDSETTFQLWKVLEAELKRQDLWQHYLEKLRNSQHIWNMEQHGTSLRMDELHSMQREYEEEADAMSDRCVALAAEDGHELQMPKGSSNNRSLTTYCFDVLKLPVIKRTDTGQPSLDKDVMEAYGLTMMGRPLEFVNNLARSRKRRKSLEFFHAYELFQIDGVLHPSLNQTGTDTTRLSCGLPNLQQVSKQEAQCDACDGEGCEQCDWTGEDLHSVRNAFGPKPGREWWTADAENIELRLPAYESGQQELIDLFERPGEPPFFGSKHLLHFSIVYPEIWRSQLRKQEKDKNRIKDAYGSREYQWCKNGGFALQYQCGQATADRAFHVDGAFAKLKNAFRKQDALNQRCLEFAQKHGYIETIPDRSINPGRGYPLLCQRGWGNRIVPTQPLSYRIQGSAGWWMVKAINRCGDKLAEWRRDGFDGWMILTVHDELVFDFPAKPRINGKPGNHWRAVKLQRLMEQGGDDYGIPTPVSLSYCPKSWGKKEKI